MSAFHKLQDHRRAYNSHDIRLSEVVAVSVPISQSGGDWYCNVALRDGTCYQIGGDMNSTYRFRDELMHALEQDAAPLVTKAIQRRRETPAGDTASERAFGR